ncbi:MAG: hypothetical protein EA425_03685 [Puniceicoccaceae bacterium]|nr:MAG: hypothetical protein EA425_03685 [Puniceicoccaceae bacterium]
MRKNRNPRQPPAAEASAPPRRPRAGAGPAVAAGAILAAFPAIAYAWLVWRHGINVPWWDDWHLADTLLHWSEGSLSPATLFEQHNESRKIVPRLLLLLLSLPAGYHPRAGMFLSFGLLLVSLLGLYRLLRGSGLERPTALVALGPISFFLFHPGQYQNALWGIQMCVFLPFAALVWGLVAARSPLPAPVRWGVAFLLAAAGTFSFANGMILLLLLPWALWFGGDRPGAREEIRWPWAAAWAVGAAVILWLYFRSYVSPPHHPSFSSALEAPFDAFRYFLAWLGNPLVNYNFTGAVIAGAFLLLLLANLLFLALPAAPALAAPTAPWLVLAGYGIASGLASTGGRVGFGYHLALQSRYISFAVALLIGLWGLAAVLARLRARGTAAPLLLFNLGLLLVLLTIGSAFAAYPSVLKQTSDRLEARVLVTFDEFAKDRSLARLVHHSPSYLRPQINRLREHGWLPERPSPSVDAPHHASRARGRLDLVRPLPETSGQVTIGGWAWLPHRGQPPEAILIAAGDPGQPEGPFHRAALLRPGRERPDVAAAVGDPKAAASGWEEPVDLSLPGDGPWLIRAWAFDARKDRLHLLPGEFLLQPSAFDPPESTPPADRLPADDR